MGRFLGPPAQIGIVSGGIFGVSPPASFTWTQLITGFEGGLAPQVFALDFANGNFIISTAGTHVIVSSDTVTWTQHNVSAFGPPVGVTFGAGTYLIVLANAPTPHVATSTDLSTWTTHVAGYPAASDILLKPVFGSGVFLTVSNSSARYATSPDGATWTLRSTYVPNAWGQPIHDGTRFLCPVLNSSNTPTIATSTDGISWTEHLTLTADFNSGSTPYFLGNDGTTQYLAAESTDDAGNNIDGGLTTAALISYANPGIGTLVRPVFSGSSWARLNAGLAGNAALCSSPTGTLFTLDTIPAGFFQSVDLAFGLGLFLALGNDSSSDLFMISRGP